jgi:CHAT domain
MTILLSAQNSGNENDFMKNPYDVSNYKSTKARLTSSVMYFLNKEYEENKVPQSLKAELIKPKPADTEGGNITINKTITVPKDFKGGVVQNIISPLSAADLSAMVANHAAANAPKPLKILMLTANPATTTKLNLDKEYARIGEKLQGKSSQFDLTLQRAVNRTEFKEFTQTVKPAILHFSGHGEESAINSPGGLAVQNEDKNGQELLSSSKLEALFEFFIEIFPMKAVILNACYSKEQAETIAKFVPYVVGITAAVKDEYAIAFSTGFYFALDNAADLDLKFAFKSGRAEARSAGAKREDFVLYENGQVLVI